MRGESLYRSTAVVASGVLVYGALVVVGLISIAALSNLGARLDAVWGSFPQAIGIRHLVLLTIYAAGAIGAIVLLRRIDADRLRRWMPWAGLALLVGVRLAVIPLIETPLPRDNDPLFLHRLAVGVLDGGNWLVAHRPMGFSSLLGALYAIFGVHPWLGEVLNLALATLAGVMLYRFVNGGWGPRAAAVALTVYALVPSQLLLVTTLYTETAYASFLIAAIAIAAAATRGGRIAIAVLAGVVLALSQYVRPLSQAFVATFVAVPLIVGSRPARSALLAAVMAITFVLVMAPIAIWNMTAHGALSLSTSSYGGWSVFVGANQEHDGRFNRDDQAILRRTEGSVWEQSEILGREGVERITSDPRGFANLVVRKFRVLWGDDAYAVGAALSGSSVSLPMRRAMELASQAAYAGLSVAATICLWRFRRRARPELLLVAGVILTVAAAHVFIEVQPRYHAYVVPLICALAAPVLAGVTQARD